MTRMKGRHASSNVTALAAAAVGSAMVASLVAFHLGKRSARHDGTLHRDNNTRQQQQRAANDNEVDGQRAEEDPSTIAATGGEESFAFRPIGRVSSIYRLCVGTPRQGLLAPHSRGILELRVHRDSISSLSDYSHLWIVFVFHLNTTGRRSSSKISPPALGGTKKIGLFASRSPHRPNPIGISLCKIDSILPPTTTNKKKGVVRIRVSGLDLVDGTPILDIKPFVPHYDSVATTTTVNVPTWVSDGLDKRRSVFFSPTSIHQLSTLMHLDKKNGMRFYGPVVDSSIVDAISNVRTCIEEVLGVDVRSTWQTGKARRGKFQAEKSLRVKEIITAEPSPHHHHHNNDGNKVTETTTTTDASNKDDVCTQQLDNLLITYVVRAPSSLPPLLVNDTPPDEAANTNKSGADDSVFVIGIDLIARDMTIVSQQKKSECQSPMTGVGANDETTTVPSSSIQDTLSKLNKVVNTDDDDDDGNSEVVQVVNAVENASSAETTTDLATKKKCEMMDQDEIGSSSGESLALPSIESASVVVAVNGEVAADDNDGLPKMKTKQQATDDLPSSSSSSLHREECQNKYHRQNAASISDIESLVVVHGEVAADDNDSLPKMKTKQQATDDLPSSSSSLNREGNNHDQNAVSISDTAISSKSSTDKGTFSSLRSYWSSAASKNTPAGIVFPSGGPRRRQSKSNHKFFVFSDKPVRLSSSSIESSFTDAAMEVHESLKVPHGLNNSVMSENGEASVTVNDMSSTRHIKKEDAQDEQEDRNNVTFY